MKTDLTTAGTAITEAEPRWPTASSRCQGQGRVRKATANTVKTAVEAAMAAKKR